MSQAVRKACQCTALSMAAGMRSRGLYRLLHLIDAPAITVSCPYQQDKDAQTLLELRDKLEMNSAYLGMVCCLPVASNLPHHRAHTAARHTLLST